MEWKTAGVILGAVFTVCAVVFALTVYIGMYHLEESIAYMALYYDDMAVENFEKSPSLSLWASAQAWRWCEMYRIEQRSMEWRRYFPLCDEIQIRTSQMILCEDYVCFGELLYQNETVYKPIREKWLKSAPYFKFVFREDYDPVICKVGQETVDCPFK